MVDDTDHLLRVDQILSKYNPRFSRSQIQSWIKQGYVWVDHTPTTKPSLKINKGQTIVIRAPLEPVLVDQPQAIELTIAYEDAQLLMINKPSGMVVHPGAGNRDYTLLNGLLAYHPPLNKLPRAGIVHRLDKDTTGLMMVAKTHESYQYLVAKLAQRCIKREYLAICDGIVKQSQTVDQPISRHPVHRQRMAVTPHGKEAITHIQIKQRLNPFTLITCQLETGRTHQIRVHCAHIGHPLLGDPTYGRPKSYQQLPPPLAAVVKAFPRQALHAARLSLPHPEHGRLLTVTCPLPEDMMRLKNLLS